ncbi:transcription antitermination protein NusB [Candidatus Curtissbacteria bacterium]|nr:transcription antitermination protein NusB [Candidatus Curtissbacteria bacterium]
MKSKTDPRHKHRIKLVRMLFAYEFDHDQADFSEILPITSSITEIDLEIAKNAPAWPIEQISKIDLAVLRLAVYELLIDKSQPQKVVIDEAIELGKEFGNEHTSSFINGVLGSVVKEITPVEASTKAETEPKAE